MCDVSERSGVDERGSSFRSLDKIREKRLLKEHLHGARTTKVFRKHGLPTRRHTNEDTAQPLTKVRSISGESQDGHDL